MVGLLVSFCILVSSTWGSLLSESLAYLEEHYPDQLLNKYEVRVKHDKIVKAFQDTIEGVVFSGIFGNGTVLQRSPQQSSVYGATDQPFATVNLTLSAENLNEIAKFQTKSNENGEWKVTFEPMDAGGNYTIIAECLNCKYNNISAILYNVTFGDVFYCRYNHSQNKFCTFFGFFFCAKSQLFFRFFLFRTKQNKTKQNKTKQWSIKHGIRYAIYFFKK